MVFEVVAEFQVSVMERLINTARFGVAVMQLAIFNIGLTYNLHLTQPVQHAPAIEMAWLDDAMEAEASRRPPRWPGRSKGQKGLAIREATAIKPLARVL